MPIKSLESYLFERKLAGTSSIEILQNATIGIDVEHYLSRIYTFKKEQFLSAIGGVPSSLKDYIQSDLLVFKEFNIKPIFIISGLNIQLQSQDLKPNELSSHELQLESTWNKLAAKQPYSYNSIETFRLFTDPLPLRPMINDLIKFFIEFGIDYLVAPYDPSFQLSYLYQNNIIDSIYGSTDLLLTKVDKFILGMEFQSKDFRYIDKLKVLNELHLTERQFLDLSIMVGCTLQPTTFPNFPPLPKPNPIQPYPQLSYFKLGLDIIYQYNSFNNNADLSGYIANLNDPNLLDLYYKGHSAFKYLPVLNKEGIVELYSVEMAKLDIYDKEFLLPIPNDSNANSNTNTNQSEKVTVVVTDKSKLIKVPTDVHDIISQRLPPEFYFYQSIGLLPIELLESITKGQYDIRPPLEIAMNDTYRKLINSKLIIDSLDYQFNLITQLLARYYQVKKIAVKYWYKEDVLDLNNRLTPPISKRIDKLFIQSDESSETFDLSKFFKNLVDNKENLSQAYISTKEIKTKEDTISTIFLRTLYLFGFINEKKELGSLGRIFKKFVEQIDDKIDQTSLQNLFLLLFLIDTKTVKVNEVNRDFSSVSRYFQDYNSNQDGSLPVGVNDLTPTEGKSISLISRVFSLVKFNIAPINYQGPISRKLLNFRSHVKVLQTQLIHTIQSVLIDFLVHQNNNNIKITYSEKEKWYGLVSQLPFFKDINSTLLGVVSEIYFKYSLKQSKQGKKDKDEIIKTTKDHIANHVFQVTTPSFNINVNGINSITSEQLWNDLSSGVKFWGHFVSLTKIANEEDKNLISDEFYQDVIAADELLKSYL